MKTLMIGLFAAMVLAGAGCSPETGPGRSAPETTRRVRETGGLPLCPGKPERGTEHDRHFRKWGRTFFSRQVDWRWFKAQGTAESNLYPKAVSPAGARGLMQLMPATSREMSSRLGVEDRPLDPELSIMMGIAYDRRLWDQWTAPRPRQERLRFTFASYNAGLGNILKAQELADQGCDPGLWSCVAPCLTRVTGDSAQETLAYLARIEAVYGEYGAGDG